MGRAGREREGEREEEKKGREGERGRGEAAERGTLVQAWKHDADFMKAQPGYISTQLHKGIAGSATYINYAIWETVESFQKAFTSPEFQKRISAYPASAAISPHLFKKLAVSGHCTD